MFQWFRRLFGLGQPKDNSYNTRVEQWTPKFRGDHGGVIASQFDSAMKEFASRAAAAIENAGIEVEGTDNFSVRLGPQGCEVKLDWHWHEFTKSSEDESFATLVADARAVVEGQKLRLDSPLWSELEQAGGRADWIPEAIQNYADESAERKFTDCFECEPFNELYGNLLHQGSVYTATYAALPHLVDIAAAGRVNERNSVLIVAGSTCGSNDRQQSSRHGLHQMDWPEPNHYGQHHFGHNPSQGSTGGRLEMPSALFDHWPRCMPLQNLTVPN